MSHEDRSRKHQERRVGLRNDENANIVEILSERNSDELTGVEWDIGSIFGSSLF